MGTNAQRGTSTKHGNHSAMRSPAENILTDLNLILRLQEERRRQSERNQWWNPRARQPNNRAGSASPLPFYQEFAETYKEIYIFYALCNRLCWNNALPQVLINMNRRRTLSTLAYATPVMATVDGQRYPGICFNVGNDFFRKCSPEQIVAILLHEMTHIWQFCCRHTSGGHGKDFKAEMARIGIAKEGALHSQIRNGSPADILLREAQLHHADMGHRWNRLYNSPHKQSRQLDLAFFAEQIRRS